MYMLQSWLAFIFLWMFAAESGSDGVWPITCRGGFCCVCLPPFILSTDFFNANPRKCHMICINRVRHCALKREVVYYPKILGISPSETRWPAQGLELEQLLY